MKEGGVRIIQVPPALAYGEAGLKVKTADGSVEVVVPPNEKLQYEITLVQVRCVQIRESCHHTSRDTRLRTSHHMRLARAERDVLAPHTSNGLLHLECGATSCVVIGWCLAGSTIRENFELFIKRRSPSLTCGA